MKGNREKVKAEKTCRFSVVCPGRPFHGTILNIKGEVFHRDVTRWSKYSMR